MMLSTNDWSSSCHLLNKIPAMIFLLRSIRIQNTSK
uniref:Uncharacterized protein n=1 Tax=Arundo donax TaxID=35708 RepID=A0A0A9FU37_ARUDO